MPLVLPQAGPPQFIRSEEILAEILGHDNFDGEPWAVGDRILFEDGTESRIEQEQGELFYVWSDSTPADLTQVTLALGLEHIDSWAALFRHYETKSKRSGCASSILILIAGPATVFGLALYSMGR